MSRERKPVPQVPRAYQRLRSLIEMRAWEAALDEARRLLVHEPDNARPYAYMANALLKLQRYGEALQAADAAIRIDANGEWYHRLRSLALSGLERHEEALRSAEEAVRLAPEERRAQFVLANCQGRCWLWAELLQTARRYERLAPDIEPPHHLRGEALWGLGDVEGARAAYEQALLLDPVTCPYLHADIGRLRLHEGHTEEAVASFLESLRLTPQLKTLEAGLAYALRRYLEAGDLAQRPETSRSTTASSGRSILATQLHVHGLRAPEGYRFWFLRDPPPLAYESPFSDAEAEEIANALQAWRSGVEDSGLHLLIEARIPASLAQALIEGKTAHHPAGLDLDDMLHHWMLAVLDLEHGYARASSDFRHDCAVRKAIDAIAQHTSPDVQNSVHQSLADWDARFRDASARAGVPVSALPRFDS